MNPRITINLLLVLAAASLEGATLKGIIQTNRLGGPPVPHVPVSVAAGATSTESDDDGKFTLIFPAKKPGEMVEVIVRKPDHQVVNWVQMRLALPIDPDAELLKIILCKEADVEAMARQFYQLKTGEAVEATYRQGLKELEDNNLATAANLEKLRQERDQATAVAETASEELARLKSDLSSELYDQAMSLFLKGKAGDALALLDDEKLRRLAKENRDLKVEAEKGLAEVVQAYLLKARLLTTQFRFEEAEKAHLAATEVAPDSSKAHFAFAVFNQELDRPAKALGAYQRCLAIDREKGSSADVAKTLNNLGNLHREQNRMDAARQAYQEALKTYRGLAAKNPESYLPDVAMTLNNLGILYRRQNRMDDARQAYEESLKIRRQFAAKNPESCLPGVAKTLNSLADLHRAQNRMDEARVACEEALKTYRQLATKNPETYLPDVAMTLSNLGILHRAQNRMDEARQAFEEALKIDRELAAKNPETYLPPEAATLNNLGNLCCDEDRMDEARQAYEEALKIRRELAAKNPEAYLPFVATTLNNLGNLHSAQNRMDDARQAYEEALKIRRELAAKNPEAYLPSVAETLNNLAVLHSAQNRTDDARQAWKEALQIYRKFAKRDPDQYQRHVDRITGFLKELNE